MGHLNSLAIAGRQSKHPKNFRARDPLKFNNEKKCSLQCENVQVASVRLEQQELHISHKSCSHTNSHKASAMIITSTRKRPCIVLYLIIYIFLITYILRNTFIIIVLKTDRAMEILETILLKKESNPSQSRWFKAGFYKFSV